MVSSRMQVHMQSVSIVKVVCMLSTCLSTKVVDLSHSYNAGTHRWPTNIPFNLTVVANGSLPNGGWYASNDVTFSEHTGTHLDAPIHFANRPGIYFTSTIPAERLITPVVRVNLQTKAAENRDYLVVPLDITEWEERHGEIPEKSVVLFDFGWSKYWSSYEQVFGSNSTDTKTFHFPGVGLEAAKILESRGVYGVGIDTPSIDFGPSTEFPVHNYLLDKNIYFLENVADMSSLPEDGKGVTLFVGVMKIDKGTGGPARLLAVIDETTKPNYAEGVNANAFSLVVSLSFALFVKLC